MRIARYLKIGQVKLGLAGGHTDTIDPEKPLEKERARLKGEVIGDLAELFSASDQVRNPTRFRKDFALRESMSSTGLENGLALPHVRSSQLRSTVVVFARTRDGVWFDAMDGEPTHVFFGIAAPPYDDTTMVRFHKWISNAFLQEDWLPAALLAAEDEHEIIKILGQLH